MFVLRLPSVSRAGGLIFLQVFNFCYGCALHSTSYTGGHQIEIHNLVFLNNKVQLVQADLHNTYVFCFSLDEDGV